MDFANYWFQAPASACGGPSYQIGNSLRFNSADSAYFSRAFSASGSLTTWTWSAWIKRSSFGGTHRVFGTGDNHSVTSQTSINFAQDALEFYNVNGGFKTSSALFRDPSAWYHVVATWDTTNGTAADRIRLYVNGTRITTFSSSSDPSPSANSVVNSAADHRIGTLPVYSGNYFNGYLAEVNFIDGQALDPTSFGEFDCNGVWRPKRYTGSRGTNGWYLDFKDPANIGADRSGNGNNFTPTGFELTNTTSAGYDWMADSPTTNYATLSPLLGSSINVIKNGNLTISDGTVGSGSYAVGTIGFPQAGKYYAEATVTAYSSGQIQLGICPTGAGSNLGGDATSYLNNGTTTKNGSTPASGGATYTVGDVIGIAVDTANSTVQFFKNGSPQVTLTSVARITGASFFGYLSVVTTQLDFNFGQRPFAHTPPTGFNALNTANLAEPTVKKGGDHFNTVLYAGNDTTRDIAVGFQPDFTWIKSRNTNNSNHPLFDSVRGVLKELYTNLTNQESSETNGLSQFNSDGFRLLNNRWNVSGTTYVAWNWKANGAGSSNTDGTIPSTVSANPTAGFSIVTYTGTGANATVGHQLGVAPKMVIVKKRSSAGGWIIGHSSIGWNKYLVFETDAATPNSTVWQDTAPASTLFSVGTSTAVNGSSETFVAYCFAEVPGYSSFGSYVGNGNADGPFIYTGFRPRWVMIKRTDAVDPWCLFDTARDTYNSADHQLNPNSNDPESHNAANIFDVLSNGFKHRSTGTRMNGSGATFIYAAFAEHPFGGANVSPSPAR